MAYGVKYRLEFSDVLGNAKKIEIEKDGYSGTVLPLIGTADPVSIKWEGDDDFYSPIIGSTCTLNLFVTDDVQYDNFYAFDEEEFKVKIYYKDDADVYQLYWAGFIVTDSYKQALQSTPYQISIQANDGLGLLSTKFVTIENDDNFNLNNSGSTPLRTNLIENCISQTNLEMNVYMSLGIRNSNSLNAHVENQIAGFCVGKYKPNLKVKTCKEYLEDALRTFNLRIFQALGNWYIVSNSDYMDNDFFLDIFNGTISSNIRSEDTKRLQTELNEIPEFRVYDDTGTFSTSSTPNVLILTKTDLTPIENDLTVEYIPPAKIVEEGIQQSVFNLPNQIANYDPTFELPTNDWTISQTYFGQIGEFDYITSGKKSFKALQTTSSSSSFTTMLTSNNGFLTRMRIDDTANFKGLFYYDGSIGSAIVRFNYDIKRKHSSGTVVRYWNAENDTWETTPQENSIDIISEKEFQSFDEKMTMDLTPSGNTFEFEIIIYLPYKSGGTFNGLYIDDLRVEKDFDLYKDNKFSQNRTVNSNKIDDDFQALTLPTSSGGSVRRAQASDAVDFPIAITQQKMNDFRTHMTRYEGTFYNNNKTPVSLRNKIWVNFSEKFVTTSSSGSSTTTLNTNDVNTSTDKIGWYVTGGNITTPVKITSVNASSYTLDTAISYSSGDEFALSSFNAVKLPVSNEYPTHEPVSCMIDSMEYNVKANTVSVVMHVPNQDNDINSTYKQTTK